MYCFCFGATLRQCPGVDCVFRVTSSSAQGIVGGVGVAKQSRAHVSDASFPVFSPATGKSFSLNTISLF